YPNTIFNPAYGLSSEYSTLFVSTSNVNSWIVEPQLNFKYKLGSGDLKILIGSSFQQDLSDNLTQYASGFSNNNFIHNLSAANYLLVFNDQKIDYRYQAFFGRINYNLKNKYSLNLTGRRDGSSRFGPNKKYANFGAIGMAWNFSEEKLFKESIPFISYGKIRGSYGATGNDQIGDYQFLDT